MQVVQNSYFSNLPVEIIIKIFSHLDPVSLSVVSLVCKHLSVISKDDSLWIPELRHKKIKLIDGSAKSLLVEHLRNYFSFCLYNKCINTSELHQKNVFSLFQNYKASNKPSDNHLKHVFNNLAMISKDILSLKQKILNRSHKYTPEKLEQKSVALQRAHMKMDSMIQSFIREEEHLTSFFYVQASVACALSDETVLLFLAKTFVDCPGERPLIVPLRLKRSDQIIKAWAEKSKVNMADLECALEQGYSEEVIDFLAQKVVEDCHEFSDKVIIKLCADSRYSDQLVSKIINFTRSIDGLSLKLALKNHRSHQIIEGIIAKLNEKICSNGTLAIEVITIAHCKRYPIPIIDKLIDKISILLKGFKS